MAVAGAGEARQDARMSGQGTEPRINLHAPTRHLAGFRSISTERATQCSSGPLGGMAGRTFSSANAPLEALRVQPCSPASRSAWHVRMNLGRVPFRVRLIEPGRALNSRQPEGRVGPGLQRPACNLRREGPTRKAIYLL